MLSGNEGRSGATTGATADGRCLIVHKSIRPTQRCARVICNCVTFVLEFGIVTETGTCYMKSASAPRLYPHSDKTL